MPTRISTGWNKVRPNVSHNNTKQAPPKAEAGITRRWSGPTKRRTMCGTTRPTKPILPPTHTEIAVIIADNSKKIIRYRLVFIPTALASTSPITKIFKCLLNAIIIAVPTAMAGNAMAT